MTPQESRKVRCRRDIVGLAVRFLLGVAVVAGAAYYGCFDDYSVPPEAQVRRAHAAIVLTGEHARIDTGLLMAHQRRVPRLFISGFTPEDGIFETFVADFSSRNPEISNLGTLMTCCVEYGIHAQSTYQNALETVCWLKSSGVAGPIVLITSRNHMARAMADLRGALPFTTIIPYPVFDAPALEGESRAREYARYLVSLVLSPMPRSLDPRDAGVFANGCS